MSIDRHETGKGANKSRLLTGEPAKLVFHRFGLEVTTHPLTHLLQPIPNRFLIAYEAKKARPVNNPHDFIDGIIVYSDEPQDANKINFTAIDKQNKIGMAVLWGLRDALEDREVIGTVANDAATLNEGEWMMVLKRTIEELQKKVTGDKQGSCLLANIIFKNTVITVNVGDSTAYLVIAESETKATTIRLNKILHKPSVQEEYARLKQFAEENEISMDNLVPTGNKGYLSQYNNKIGGRLAISRALGDNQFDMFGLIHDPDIYFKKIAIPKGGKAFIISACDGLTEPQDMEKIIGKLVAANINKPADEIAKLLAMAALNEGSEDNISVIVTPVDPKDEKVKYTAVFDGHGGDRVAEELYKYFHTELNNQVKKKLEGK